MNIDLGASRFLERFRHDPAADDMRLDHHEVQRHAGEIRGRASAAGTEGRGRSRGGARGEKPPSRQRIRKGPSI